MLRIQEYLTSGKTFDDLESELGISASFHPTLPLVILNYSQIESPKTHPVVRECRALTLHTETKDVIARSFPRFYNWGEVQDEMKLFDFADFVVQSKEDGSLVVIYYYDGHWHANTRGSFGLDNMQFQDFTWREGFCKTLGISNLDELGKWCVPGVTYICEFCSTWNKVVRIYKEPVMYLLTAFEGLYEVSNARADALAQPLFRRPERYNFCSIDEIQDFLRKQSEIDPSFEGVVIKDGNGQRWKIKSATYLGLHKIRGEGDNLFNPKHLLPFVMAGEEDELLTYYPEIAETFFRLKSQVQRHYIELLEVWADHKNIPDQKEFAMAINGKTPFTSVLFSARKKHGLTQKSVDVRKEWRDAESMILKKIKV